MLPISAHFVPSPNNRQSQCGVQICEDSGRQVFGTKNELMNRFPKYWQGSDNIEFDIRMNLAPGRYVAGLAIYDSGAGEDPKLLVWWDRLMDF